MAQASGVLCVLSLQWPNISKAEVVAGDGFAVPAHGTWLLSRALKALRVNEVYIPYLGRAY